MKCWNFCFFNLCQSFDQFEFFFAYQMKKLKELRLMLGDSSPGICLTVRKYATVSLMEVFKDIVPGYRLRIPTEKETAQRVRLIEFCMLLYSLKLWHSLDAFNQSGAMLIMPFNTSQSQIVSIGSAHSSVTHPSSNKFASPYNSFSHFSAAAFSLNSSCCYKMIQFLSSYCMSEKDCQVSGNTVSFELVAVHEICRLPFISHIPVASCSFHSFFEIVQAWYS